ncbi:beta-N-acetylhexosaminidase [Alkalicaulis satelles]|uniref:beta-N-acetylhexosaminidase n=1 Tax=Alkalicaulis satelles TaxID=2609175 RepID=A0A5M6ZN84_9PROT|nr:beta-N-acetylhexosaminidase [Alkalicaulis satelles]KAA5805375.1 beta-N-acetylhexosaminidase [Alkalicaulis satelles]
MSGAAAVAFSVEGETLGKEEKAFFRDCDPWGFILFARNVDRPRQVRALTDSLRDCVGRDAPVFIDQEGGRVQRLRPPHWRAAPPAARFAALWDREPELALEAVRINHRLIAHELYALGIDADYAPCADIRVEGAHDVIGDRALHSDPHAVAAMATAALEGLLHQGVLGVIKHLPGHGRAGADSHFELPVVEADEETLARTDFAAFRGIKGALMAMTAHLVYTAIDRDDCATFSSEVITRVIRGDIGFDGLLMSDDLVMKALSGPLRQRTSRAFAAGCDLVIHNGAMPDMIEIAHATPRLDHDALRRADAALAARRAPDPFDPDAGQAALARLFEEAGLDAP